MALDVVLDLPVDQAFLLLYGGLTDLRVGAAPQLERSQPDHQPGCNLLAHSLCGPCKRARLPSAWP